MSEKLKKPILTIIGIFVGIAVVFAQEKINKTFTGIEEIEMSIASGDAIFQKSSGKEISVNLEHTFNIDYKPTIEQRGSKLYIDEKRMEGRNRSYSGEATWTISIPDNVEIEFNTGSGDIDITGLTLELDMNSGSGDFEIKNSKGKFKINTGSGDIEAKDVEGDLSFNCGSGDIELNNIIAEISANVGSGSVEASGIKLTGRSSFNSGSGDVEVTLGTSPDFDISVNSGSGDALLDFEGNNIEGLVVMQTNKKNGRIRAPFEFDTEEEIEQGRNNTTIKKTKQFGSKDVRIKIGSGSGIAEIIQ